MNDVTQLAQEAIAVLTPLLPAAGHIADSFLSESGKKLFNWLSSKLKGTPAETTLDRAVAEPTNARRLDALRLEIEELAEKDEEFKRQLAEFLKGTAGSAAQTQTATTIGDNNKVAQAAGTSHTIHIG
jgi:hypothetical protein